MNEYVEVKHGRNHLITNQWCKLLTSVRETIINVNGSQSTQYNPWDVNRCVDVEHVTESFDRRSMMKPVIEGKKPAIKAWKSQGTDDFYIIFLYNELKSIESDPS